MKSCTIVTNPSGELELSKLQIREYNIPFQIPGSKADRELLHYYCCQTAGDLSSSLDADLWTHLILQRGHDEPVIRNALVTLSSLHKDYLYGNLQGGSPNSGVTQSPPARSLSLVARSHRQLRNYLFKADASLEVALICSIIFFSFESLLGEPERAIEHLDHGLMLLKQSQAELGLKINDDGFRRRLIALYQRLDIQASAFNDLRRPILTLVSSAERTGSISVAPTFILDNHHAEAVLTRLQNWTLHHIIEYVGLKRHPWDKFPPDVLHERQVLATQFDQYGYALEQFGILNGINSPWASFGKQPEQTTQFLFLRTQFLLFRSLLSENLPNTLWPRSILQSAEASQGVPGFLTFSSNPNDSFRLVLSDLMRLISTKNGSLTNPSTKPMPSATTPPSSRQGTPSESQRRTFTLSSQVVTALYFLSLKTTDPEILSQARAMLSSIHGRDGLWDAETVSFIVEELAQSHTSSEHSVSSVGTSPMSEEGSQQSEVASSLGSIDPAYQWDQFYDGVQGTGGTAPRVVETTPVTRLEDIGHDVIDADGGVEEVAKLLREKMVIRTEEVDI